MTEQSQERSTSASTAGRRLRRAATGALLALAALAATPAVSAHGGAHYLPHVHQWQALVVLLVGLGVVGGAVALRRRWLRDDPTAVLAAVFVGLVVATVGSVGLVQLTPVQSVTASQSPVDRGLFRPLALTVGLTVVLGSLALGRLRWPSRPRYAALGVSLGLWIAYPAAFAPFQPSLNPVGYAVFAAVPLTVIHIVRRDCADAVRTLFADRVARLFGLGVGVVGTAFFAFSAGMVTVIPDVGTGLPTTHPLVAVLPVQDPLVYWTAVEFWFPSVPLGGYLSVGMVVLVGMLAGLIAINGAFVAYRWRCRGGTSLEGATGAAALAAPNACCCCGPVLSQLAVVALGPTAAAPFYWLFVDVASPVGISFFAVSLALLLGNVVRIGGALSGSRAPSAGARSPDGAGAKAGGR